MANKLWAYLKQEEFDKIKNPRIELFDENEKFLRAWYQYCENDIDITDEPICHMQATFFLNKYSGNSAKLEKNLIKSFEKPGKDIKGIMIDIWQKQKTNKLREHIKSLEQSLKNEQESNKIDSYEEKLKEIGKLHNAALSELETTKQQLSATQVALEKERQNKGGVKMSNNNDIDEITQWEYTETTTSYINDLGKEGWEAFGCNQNANKVLLKRPLAKIQNPNIKKQRNSDSYGYSR